MHLITTVCSHYLKCPRATRYSHRDTSDAANFDLNLADPSDQSCVFTRQLYLFSSLSTLSVFTPSRRQWLGCPVIFCTLTHPSSPTPILCNLQAQWRLNSSEESSPSNRHFLSPYPSTAILYSFHPSWSCKLWSAVSSHQTGQVEDKRRRRTLLLTSSSVCLSLPECTERLHCLSDCIF